MKIFDKDVERPVSRDFGDLTKHEQRAGVPRTRQYVRQVLGRAWDWI